MVVLFSEGEANENTQAHSNENEVSFVGQDANEPEA
jgi:hypothetical protein